jgi:hypothetical protein
LQRRGGRAAGRRLAWHRTSAAGWPAWRPARPGPAAHQPSGGAVAALAGRGRRAGRDASRPSRCSRPRGQATYARRADRILSPARAGHRHPMGLPHLSHQVGRSPRPLRSSARPSANDRDRPVWPGAVCASSLTATRTAPTSADVGSARPRWPHRRSRWPGGGLLVEPANPCLAAAPPCLGDRWLVGLGQPQHPRYRPQLR